MITYCTNIHPGESWDEIFSNIKTHVLAVKKAVSPHESFPVGLRLSHEAAREINKDASRRFRDWLEERGCHVPTINGFPYASFHRPGLKEGVYLPDWRSGERAVYTMLLADLLASWLPADVTGSISTVPAGFKTRIGREDYRAVRRNLLAVLEHIDRHRQKKGCDIVLSLEPEPGCVIETTADALSFFERMNFPEELRRGAGVCLDLCHQAVEFETLSEATEMLSRAGIRIGKVQVSAGLCFLPPETDGLGDFDEPCYLHQVVVRDGDGFLTRYNDIPEALRLHPARSGEEWRVHFHVPIYAERTRICGTTNFLIEESLPLFSRDVLLEIETYTWRILPAELQAGTVTESVIREMEWLRSKNTGVRSRNETHRSS